MVVVSYMGGNEGASMVGGLYLINYLIFSVVNGNMEIIDLLKRVKITVVPALNVDALIFKSSEHQQGRATNPIKNRNTGVLCNDPNKESGVNLRYNFGPNFSTNVDFCNSDYPGKSEESEQETKALIELINKTEVEMVIALQKYQFFEKIIFSGEHEI